MSDSCALCLVMRLALTEGREIAAVAALGLGLATQVAKLPLCSEHAERFSKLETEARECMSTLLRAEAVAVERLKSLQ